MKNAMLVLTATALSVATFAASAATDNLAALRSAASVNAGRFRQITTTRHYVAPTNDNQVAYEQRSSYQQRLDAARNLASETITSNSHLRVACTRLAEEVYRQWGNYTNQLAQTAAYSNLYVIVSAQATAAQAKIADEIADLEAKIVKYQEYQTKYPLLKAIFAAMITDAENRIKILQALTGSST